MKFLTSHLYTLDTTSVLVRKFRTLAVTGYDVTLFVTDGEGYESIGEV